MIYIVGCGTLGSRVAHKLSTHSLALIDHDVVQEHNLQTQQFSKRDIGTQKVYALMRKIPTARTFNTFLDQQNINLLKQAEVVVDCTDNLLTRELLDWYCFDNGIPLVHAAAARSRGIAGLFCDGVCLRSVYKDKISLENCRGNEIDTDLADALADIQADYVTEVLAGREHPQLQLVYPDSSTEITLTKDTSSCKEAFRQEPFYITWCPQAQTLSAKRLKTLPTQEREVILSDSVTAHILADGEIHFYGSEDIDALKRYATQIYSNEIATSPDTNSNS